MKTPRIIARYLPQFHRVKENDEWWGEGFTDWTTVQQGKPLYDGHKQPHVPLHGNYYDLLQKETMMWQAGLAGTYGIDGMAFYHYWFKDGRRILEKPAENLLRWKDVPLPFCFCWANESWARTWSKLMRMHPETVNSWTEDAGSRKEGAGRKTLEDGILLDERYGDENDWRDHIEYLLPFFKDARYLTVDGHPVFMIYKPDNLYCLPAMLDCWNRVLKSQGIPSLYVIGECWRENPPRLRSLDARLSRYPRMRPEDEVSREGAIRSRYDRVWRHLLDEVQRMEDPTRPPMLFNAFVGYDNTPRMGSRGCVYEGATPETFCRCLERLLAIEARKRHPFVFINAWNEWGEGMYLEPDEEHGCAMLEAVKRAKEACTSGDVSLEAASAGKQEASEKPQASVEELQAQVDKDRKAFAQSARIRQILVDWLSIAQHGVHVSDYLKRLGMNRIAVYGIGFLGQRFIEDLEAAGLELIYAVDQRADAELRNVPLYHPGDTLPSADAIVVTPCGYYDEIYADMKGRVPCRMISLEHMISELV